MTNKQTDINDSNLLRLTQPLRIAEKDLAGQPQILDEDAQLSALRIG